MKKINKVTSVKNFSSPSKQVRRAIENVEGIDPNRSRRNMKLAEKLAKKDMKK